RCRRIDRRCHHASCHYSLASSSTGVMDYEAATARAGMHSWSAPGPEQSLLALFVLAFGSSWASLGNIQSMLAFSFTSATPRRQRSKVHLHDLPLPALVDPSDIGFDVVLFDHRAPELHLVRLKLALHVRATDLPRDLHRLDAALDRRFAQGLRKRIAETIEAPSVSNRRACRTAAYRPRPRSRIARACPCQWSSRPAPNR